MFPITLHMFAFIVCELLVLVVMIPIAMRKVHWHRNKE